MWEKNYQAPNQALWVGRSDAVPNSCLFQMIQCHDLRNDISASEHQLRFAVLGFACDAGVKRNQGRLGAKAGPDAIRRVLGAVPVKRTFLTIYDVGNVICDHDDLESAQGAVAAVVTRLLHNNIIPIILGGGHELAWGHYQGIAQKAPDRLLSIVNFDAHFDMRPLLANDQGSSGTSFLQIANYCLDKRLMFDYTCIGVQAMGNTAALEQTAQNFHVHSVYAEKIHEEGLNTTQEILHGVINRSDAIYVSLCLDVFASPFAPGVSAPQILGLMPWHVHALLRTLTRSKKVVSFDLAEYNPTFDIDFRTAKLAASLIYHIIHDYVV